MKQAILSLILVPLIGRVMPVLAVPGGRCAGTHNDNYCICLDRAACVNTYGGIAWEGTPGNYPCPNDAGNIWGCQITNRCPGLSGGTLCMWRQGCNYPSRVLPNPVCPGGNDFVCCDYIS